MSLRADTLHYFAWSLGFLKNHYAFAESIDSICLRWSHALIKLETGMPFTQAHVEVESIARNYMYSWGAMVRAVCRVIKITNSKFFSDPGIKNLNSDN